MGFGSAGPRGSKAKRGEASRGVKSRFGARAATGCEGVLADVAGLGAIIDWITDSGDAITIGKTSDGSAYAIRILSDDGGERIYEGTQAGVDEAFARLAEYYRPKETGA